MSTHPIQLHPNWVVTLLVVLLPTTEQDRPSIIEELERALAGSAPFACWSGDRIFVSSHFHGPESSAKDQAMEAVTGTINDLRLDPIKVECDQTAQVGEVRAALSRGDSALPVYDSISDVAQKLGVSKQRTSALLERGKLPAPKCRIGRSVGFDSAEIDDFVQQRKEAHG